MRMKEVGNLVLMRRRDQIGRQLEDLSQEYPHSEASLHRCILFMSESYFLTKFNAIVQVARYNVDTSDVTQSQAKNQ